MRTKELIKELQKIVDEHTKNPTVFLNFDGQLKFINNIIFDDDDDIQLISKK